MRSVSYTHLDVYKRQVLYASETLILSRKIENALGTLRENTETNIRANGGGRCLEKRN